MSRNLSPHMINATQELESDSVFLLLLTIKHPTLAEPFRLVNDTVKIYSLGHEYTPYPFNIILSGDDGEHLQTVSLTIDNIDRMLVETIRTLAEPPVVGLQLVLAEDPNIVEIELTQLELREVSWDASTISGELYHNNMLDARFPADKIDISSGYVGLFRG